MLRPPRHVDVLDDGGRPDFVRGERIGGRVVALSGPWRLAGEWWSEHRFARDYYDMSLTDGGVYRLYRDRRTGAWFVEGEYD
jgi:protein ImuB